MCFTQNTKTFFVLSYGYNQRKEKNYTIKEDHDLKKIGRKQTYKRYRGLRGIAGGGGRK